jgi:hypothetical protein
VRRFMSGGEMNRPVGVEIGRALSGGTIAEWA